MSSTGQPGSVQSHTQGAEVMEVMEERVIEIRDIYRAKTAALLGFIQILCGGSAVGLEIAIFGQLNYYYYYRNGSYNDPDTTLPMIFNIHAGFWCAVLYFVTGAVTFAAACRKTKCTVTATLVLSLLSAVAASCLIVLSSFLAMRGYCLSGYYDVMRCSILYILLIIFGGVLSLIISISLAYLACRATYLCCRKTTDRPRPVTTDSRLHFPLLQSATTEGGQPLTTDPADERQHAALSNLNSQLQGFFPDPLVPMYFRSTAGTVHCADGEACGHIPIMAKDTEAGSDSSSQGARGLRSSL